MNLYGINSNPISQRWKERYASQTDEVKAKLDNLSGMNPKDYQLKVIKKSKVEPMEGDVFVLSPKENIYLYGKVLKANIQHVSNDIFIYGKSVIFIFKHLTNQINADSFTENYTNLLIEPSIVDSSYWKKGYFFTVSHDKSSEEEKLLDYGFYKLSNGNYYTEEGIELNRIPKLLGTYGVSSITGIASKVWKELIIDTDLSKMLTEENLFNS